MKNTATPTTAVKIWYSKKNKSGLVPVYIQTNFIGNRRFKSTGLWIEPTNAARLLPIIHRVCSPVNIDLSLRKLVAKYDSSSANKKIILGAINQFQFCLDKKPILSDLTTENLILFKEFMKERNNTNSTISNRLRSLRVLFNYSRQLKLHDNSNPFIRGLIPTPKPRKKVVNWIVPDNDFYKLQLSLGGMDFADAFQIIPMNLGVGYHEYVRYKNRNRGASQIIFICDNAFKIMNRIRDSIRFSSLTSMRRYQNKKLAAYGLSSKCPRYQVAQWLQHNRCPRETIAEILGHTRNDVTDRYLQPEKIKKWIEKLNRKLSSQKV